MPSKRPAHSRVGIVSPEGVIAVVVPPSRELKRRPSNQGRVADPASVPPLQVLPGGGKALALPRLPGGVMAEVGHSHLGSETGCRGQLFQLVQRMEAPPAPPEEYSTAPAS